MQRVTFEKIKKGLQNSIRLGSLGSECRNGGTQNITLLPRSDSPRYIRIISYALTYSAKALLALPAPHTW